MILKAGSTATKKFKDYPFFLLEYFPWFSFGQEIGTCVSSITKTFPRKLLCLQNLLDRSPNSVDDVSDGIWI